MMPATEDAALVERSLSGDRGAFGALIDRHKNLVYGFLLNRIGDFDEAEDLAQEVFVEAYVGLGALKEYARFPNGLCGIVRNLCNKWLERRNTEREVRAQTAPRTWPERRSRAARSWTS